MTNILSHAKDGDIILFKNGERAFVNLLIRKVQYSCLKDLGIGDEKARQFCVYTHAGIYQNGPNGPQVAHAYAPKCQVWPLSRFYNNFVIILRPSKVTPDVTQKLQLVILRDVILEKKYSIRDLVFFYFRFYWKVWSGKHFDEVFRDKRADFCSATIVRWYRDAGLDLYPKELVESVYPARIAYGIDTGLYQLIDYTKIV
jgi:hypothetical protein